MELGEREVAMDGEPESNPSHKVSSKPSITFTVLILCGAGIALFGCIVVVFGLAAPTAIELKLGEFELNTSSAGLALVALGVGLAAYVATHLPDTVRVFGKVQETFPERVARHKLALLLVFGLFVLLFLVSLVVS
jgi:hypothetical protein